MEQKIKAVSDQLKARLRMRTVGAKDFSPLQQKRHRKRRKGQHSRHHNRRRGQIGIAVHLGREHIDGRRGGQGEKDHPDLERQTGDLEKGIKQQAKERQDHQF